ncbi:hypothetical protein [Sphingomonas lenta]|uniref:ATP-grasp domain-containing protein n=1 Tax=Sphingomonas lenta TaxID=1141887 RepID=A0A2A2SJB9_9SPHN|nr:hypothetical protein [Sphingomonas lenta]PAX09250.1 hypothetical protein CKY28_00320 [Sphingomonas lenta]
MRHDTIRAAGPASPIDALAMIRATPHSPLARLRLWYEMVALGNERQAALAKEAVLRLVGGSPDGLAALAFDAVRVGAFAQAEELLDLAGPRYDYETLLTRSALRLEAGDPATAAALRRIAAKAAPVVMSPSAPDAPLILKTRSMDAARFELRFRGERGFVGRFKGGHLPLERLIDVSARRIAAVNLFDDERSFAVAGTPALIINTVASPDLGAPALDAIGRHLAAQPRVPVINRPEAVARTAPDRAAALMGGIASVRFPTVRRYGRDASAEAIERDFAYPFLAREVGTEPLELVADRDALTARLASATDFHIASFEDARDAHGTYRKARAVLVDGKLVPVALLGSDEWRVRSTDRRAMLADERLRDDERDYLADPAKLLGARRWSALRAVCVATRLDYVGVDFAPTADGVLVFGLDAAMRHDLGPADGNAERVSAAFQAMVDKKLR